MHFVKSCYIPDAFLKYRTHPLTRTVWPKRVKKLNNLWRYTIYSRSSHLKLVIKEDFLRFHSFLSSPMNLHSILTSTHLPKNSHHWAFESPKYVILLMALIEWECVNFTFFSKLNNISTESNEWSDQVFPGKALGISKTFEFFRWFKESRETVDDDLRSSTSKFSGDWGKSCDGDDRCRCESITDKNRITLIPHTPS